MNVFEWTISEETMENPWRTGLHRRSFISTHVDDIQDTIRLVSPINRFALFQGNIVTEEDENLNK